ncbi:MAG: glycosyltransferase [Candidatus Omnitrophota bacterium]
MKIFIIYASAGAGHKKAGEALFEAAKTTAKECDVELFDALDYTNPFFKWFYGASYLFAINYLSFIWGFFYYSLDCKPVYALARPLRSLLNFLNSKRLRDKFINEKPDVIISVHFFASQVAASLIRKGVLKTKLITVLTDFRPHYVWINRETHFYTTALDSAKEELSRRGVPEEKVKVYGIPVSPLFSRQEEKNTLRKKLGFGEKNFVVLTASGGFGVGPIEKMLERLDKSSLNVEMAVVCGKNQALFEKLKKAEFNKKISIFGFVDNMHELMKASDLIVTKAGGLSVSESLACNLPLVIVRPVPGQEGRNCRILVQNKLAVKLTRLKDLENIIFKFIRDKENNIQAENIKAIARPRAAFDIMEFAMLYAPCAMRSRII